MTVPMPHSALLHSRVQYGAVTNLVLDSSFANNIGIGSIDQYIVLALGSAE